MISKNATPPFSFSTYIAARKLLFLCSSNLSLVAIKLSTRKLQPREFLQLGKSLESVHEIKKLLAPHSNNYLQHISNDLATCETSKNAIFNTRPSKPLLPLLKEGLLKLGFQKVWMN